MGFVEGFINFELNISNSIRETYDSKRIRIAKHPLEDLEHLCARILCFAHGYREDLKFSDKPNHSDSPAIINIDASGNVSQWFHVGKVNSSSLRHAVKHNRKAEVECYFYKIAHLDNFCHELRGSKTNWVDSVVFWKIEEELLIKSMQALESRNNWSFSIVDEEMYVTTPKTQFAGTIRPASIWEEYQEHLNDSV